MADPATLRLEPDPGGTAVVWDLEALAGVGGAAARPFVVEPALDAGRWELARILSAAFEDGRLLALAALRPAGAAGHGDEAVAGAFVRDGRAAALDEALLSVEYDPRGEVRRIGLELYEDPDALPIRIAGDRRAAADAGDAVLDLRSDGLGGVGRLALVRPG